MLNNEELGNILNQTIPSLLISDIHWRTQESTTESILFYKITEDQKSLEQFVQRIKDAKYAWLVINRKVEGISDKVSVIDENQWPEIQKKILDKLYPLPKLKFIGVTGTNGKTTTADLVLQIGHLIGKKGLSIGTLGVREYQKMIVGSQEAYDLLVEEAAE